jgi:hypothetical protein
MKTKNKRQNNTNLIKNTMKISENITVIIPVHTQNNKAERKMLLNALNSIKENTMIPSNVIFVVSPKAFNKIEKSIFDYPQDNVASLTVNMNNEDTSFQGNVNAAVEQVKTPYFMILEMDDELPSYAIEMADKYISTNPTVGMYMPLVAELDKDMKSILKYSNEMLWVKDMNETLGELSHSLVQEYSDFNLTGCYINTEAFKAAGKLKTNIEVTFNYEFLLRFTQGKTIKSIPYVLYNHRNGREGSLLQQYNEYHPSELQYWFDVAKNEYIFETQRELDRVDSE